MSQDAPSRPAPDPRIMEIAKAVARAMAREDDRRERGGTRDDEPAGQDRRDLRAL